MKGDSLPEHTYGLKINGKDECPRCPGPHGGPGPCDLRTYTRKDRRHIEAHIEEYTAAYENPDVTAASHVLARLHEERANCPRGHVCNEPGGCPFENKARQIPPCPACRARWKAQVSQICADCERLPRQFRPKDCPQCAALSGLEFGAEIGRTTPVNPPAPMTLLLDFFGGNMP